MKALTKTEPRPAATVVVLRESEANIEVLLLERNAALVFAGGYWVFPGGAIDEEDWLDADNNPDLAARRAAIREAHEEAGVALGHQRSDLVGLGQWIGPKGESKRFSTHYYLTHWQANTPVVVDGSEIVDHQWLSIHQALRLNRAGKLPLYPPTWFTLRQLARFDRAAQALATMAQLPHLHVIPVFSQLDGQHVTLFKGDQGYHRGQADHRGARHRMWQRDNEWYYEYHDVDAAIRPLDGRDIITPGID